MKPAIIVDLDGTLYDCADRRKTYLEGHKQDFDGFNAAAKDDPPHSWCLQLCQAMSNAGHTVIFVTGRERKHGAFVEVTDWLWKHLRWTVGDGKYYLFMREPGDYRPDEIVKADIFDTEIDNPKLCKLWDITFVVDDRKKVVDMWRSKGLRVLHCDEGAF